MKGHRIAVWKERRSLCKSIVKALKRHYVKSRLVSEFKKGIDVLTDEYKVKSKLASRSLQVKGNEIDAELAILSSKRTNLYSAESVKPPAFIRIGSRNS